MLKKTFFITLTFLTYSNLSLASSVKSCATAEAQKSSVFDYGNAPTDGVYGTACHDTNAWQQLGEATIDGEAIDITGRSTNDTRSQNDGWDAATDKSQASDNDSAGATDNGVTWKVQNSDGSWPTEFGTVGLTQGANVEFQFVVQRSTYGWHEFDQLKAWVDWDGENGFDNDNSEILIDEKWYKTEDHGEVNEFDDSHLSWNNDRQVLATYHNKTVNQINADYSTYKNTVRNSIDTIGIFNVATQVPFDAVLGDTWLRARVICENSLHWSDRDNNVFLPTGYYHQGEVEDYKLAINQVPEPTTILVFSSALIGLTLSRKKRKNT